MSCEEVSYPTIAAAVRSGQLVDIKRLLGEGMISHKAKVSNGIQIITENNT